MVKDKISITVDRDLLKTIDENRGITKRSSYINTVLREVLKPTLDMALQPEVHSSES